MRLSHRKVLIQSLELAAVLVGLVPDDDEPHSSVKDLLIEPSAQPGATRRIRTDDLLITKNPSADQHSLRPEWRRRPGESSASAKRLSLLGNQCAYQRSVVLGSE